MITKYFFSETAITKYMDKTLLINNYMQDLLHSKNVLTSQNIKSDLCSFIFQKLTRKKFRKKKLWSESIDDIKTRIHNSVTMNKPINLIIPFGGYKHFRNQQDTINRAEFFHIISMIDYVRPVLEAYEPGVHIEFVSEDIILPYMNWYTTASLENYNASFKSLLSFLALYFPRNLNITYKRVSDMVNKELMIARVFEVAKEKEVWRESLSHDEKVNNLHRSKRSVIDFDIQSFASIDLDDSSHQVIQSRLLELAFYDVEAEDVWLWNYYIENDKIMMLFSFGTTDDNVFDNLTIWSLSNSRVDFWIGKWLLEYRREDKIIPRIVSHQQYKSFTRGQVASIPISLSGLPDPLSSIEVFEWALSL